MRTGGESSNIAWVLYFGIALGVLAGYLVSVARRTGKDLQTARSGVKMLSRKRLIDTWYAGLAVVVIVVALAMLGAGEFG